jgi:undecaprenyl-diphosphatase
MKMKERTENYLKYAAGFLLAFIVYTILVKTVDVRAIGPLFSKVGFSHFNDWVRDIFKYNKTWYTISQFFGYLAIAVCICFACTGAYQLFTGKQGIRSVSRGIWAIGGLYVVLAILYIFFDKVLVINYRPVLGTETPLEPSYPSSHTLLAVCVFLSASDQAARTIERTDVASLISVGCWIAASVTVLSRLLSGMHWATDIFGALILSASLLFFYLAAAGDK